MPLIIKRKLFQNDQEESFAKKEPFVYASAHAESTIHQKEPRKCPMFIQDFHSILTAFEIDSMLQSNDISPEKWWKQNRHIKGAMLIELISCYARTMS